MQAQAALRDSEERYRNLTDLSSDWDWETDDQLRFTRFGGKTDLSKMDLSARLGHHPWDASAANMTAEDWQAHKAEMQAHQSFHNLELQRVTPDGHIQWTAVSGAPVFAADGSFQGYRGIGRDITEHKRVEAEIERLAFYDPLTSLPNRRLLLDRLRQALPACERRHDHGALLFLDLDNFKIINDTLGHHVGDALLQQVAERLTRCVRQIDTVARLGGDEFVVMLEELSSEAEEAAAQVEAVGKKILTSLNQAFRLAGQDHSATPAQHRRALFSDQLQDVDELLKRADMAMYQAKAAGRNTLRFFRPPACRRPPRRAPRWRWTCAWACSAMNWCCTTSRWWTWSAASRGGGAGALAASAARPGAAGRIHPGGRAERPDPAAGPVGAGDGLPAVGGLERLGRATRSLSIAVNVSARQFRHPEFATQILTLLRKTGANPYRLKLELTESLLLSDLDDAIVKMTELRSIGVSFALDDFGTGYSSLSYLKLLPLDQLKIDQSFVRDVLTDPNDAAIARTILTLAHSLDWRWWPKAWRPMANGAFCCAAAARRSRATCFGRPVPVEELVLG